MATIRLRETGEVIEGHDKVQQFLESQEVLYEHWDMSKLPAELNAKFVLTDEEKAQILTAFDTDIRDLAERRSYVDWDIIALSDSTPNLDELLAKFKNVHTHTDDEVRAITAGHGIFVVKGESGYYNIELEPGDVISVPEHTPHFFTLMDDRQVVAVRLFIDTDGWVAHPYEEKEYSVE
ncbi:1,2-dihydroxy-3-keto-5-methylthiopentene dioxygenase [Aureibacillus halotolerans]|uniref:Acireductone dioxygenase n=1 Tax=Aureibacillus halotolerans TaxID=1508390 RepID=A0A4R6U5M8_9BACI|nr:cupin domain-containing protein [Aureibacillus halotolerans]TDQ39795.1 acireductone dioxygenase apoprotein [Aureibacillus halotolerans]